MLGKPGIHLKPCKNTAECTPVAIPVPERVTITLSTFRGSVNEPIVKVGDTVQVGQPIAPAKGGLAVPVHATVSGTVEALTKLRMTDGSMTPAVVLKSDGLQTPWEGIKVPTVTNREDFVSVLRESGLTGLGGAGFPTWAKFSAEAEILLLNGSECEPYCTADYELMCSNPKDVLEGASLVRKYVGIQKIVVGIKETNTKAIEAMKQAAAGMEGVEISPLHSFYPVGAEKMCIKETTGRIVPRGKLPKDVGVIVLNVGSAAFIAQHLRTGMPLVTKTVTMDGSALKEPKIVSAPIGTPIGELFDAAGGFRCEPSKIISGGPMMGLTIPDLKFPLLRQNNAFLALDEKDAFIPPESACIHCARCITNCPMNLMPTELAQACKAKDGAKLDKLMVDLCIECGICAYVCPAKRDLVTSHRLAKGILRNYQMAQKEAQAK
ncbi:MAG: electron transport complex subunit RsxC [Pseudoflavonifractor sp.]